MEHDEGKIDEMVLALLYLTTFKDGLGMRAWKGQDWAAMERLYKAGYIADPQNKAKSVRMPEDRLEKSRELFERHFMRQIEQYVFEAVDDKLGSILATSPATNRWGNTLFAPIVSQNCVFSAKNLTSVTSDR
jgi:Domain of unknown function (DUF6429)